MVAELERGLFGGQPIAIRVHQKPAKILSVERGHQTGPGLRVFAAPYTNDFETPRMGPQSLDTWDVTTGTPDEVFIICLTLTMARWVHLDEYR